MEHIITQICATIQGEGPTVGTPVLLLRLGNCNLNCSFCDTSWSKRLVTDDLPIYNPSEEIKFPFVLQSNQLSDFCKNVIMPHIEKYYIKAILITGGEPFIAPEFLKQLITTIREETPIKFFEVETNGTKITKQLLMDMNYPLQLNVSPKLNPTFYSDVALTSIEDIIDLFKYKIKNVFESWDTIFKFVYDPKIESNLNLFIERLNLDTDFSIYIMPLTPDHTKFNTEMEFFEAFRKSSYQALDYCMKKGYNFSMRSHVWLFNNFTNRNEFEDVRKEI